MCLVAGWSLLHSLHFVSALSPAPAAAKTTCYYYYYCYRYRYHFHHYHYHYHHQYHYYYIYVSWGFHHARDDDTQRISYAVWPSEQSLAALQMFTRLVYAFTFPRDSF